MDNKDKKWLWTAIIILGIYLIFLVYNNINLTKEREYIYYGTWNINGNLIDYNTMIINGTEPIFFPGGEKAILLLHGLGGTPVEMSELAYYLADKNITILVPLLPFQGRGYEDISRIDRTEVYNNAKKYLDILKKDYDKVYVGGLSTGGLIALKWAEEEDVSGIVSLSSPIVYGFNFLGDSTIYIFKFLRIFTPNLRRVEYGLAKNESVKKILPSFDRLPVKTLIEGGLLKKEVKTNLGKINEPILIIQSNFDNRAAPSSAKYIYDNVNFNVKKLVYLNNSGHVITMDYDKQNVFLEVFKFIEEN